MTQIERGALALLGLVGGHHLGLVAKGTLDGFGEGLTVAGQQALEIGLDPFEEGQIPDQAVFDDLGEASPQLAVRQGAEGGDVGQHQPGLVEGTDHVLAERMVDRRLATDGRIDLCEQCRRHLDERHAAQIGRRGETRQVADDAAAERDQRRLALAARAEQLVEQPVERFPGLVCLAITDDDREHLHARGFERALQPRKVVRRDGLVGDDRCPLLRHVPREQCRVVEQVGSDVDRIGAIAEPDGGGQHSTAFGWVTERVSSVDSRRATSVRRL